jgi:hypothetical protein
MQVKHLDVVFHWSTYMLRNIVAHKKLGELVSIGSGANRGATQWYSGLYVWFS